jgi:hypothetical protein
MCGKSHDGFIVESPFSITLLSTLHYSSIFQFFFCDVVWKNLHN